MRVGIIGAGSIATSMARTLSGMTSASKYAIASRSIEKAEKFKTDYGFEKAYGSYAELLADPDVDIIYIATPHSEHYENMKACIAAGKSVLCEKAFTRNAKEAKEILALAEEKGVVVTEAIWTRYMPSRKIINDLLDKGVIGKVTSLTANLHYVIKGVKRLIDPALAGGALLDVGVYPINFAMMHFGHDIERVESSCSKTDTGVDATDSITIYYKDGRTAFLNAGMLSRSDRHGIFFGDNGYMVVDNINDPLRIQIFDMGDNLVDDISVPEQITGYEYQVEELMETIKAGKLECESMPHAETIRVMEFMDDLRKSWGVTYPGEDM